MERILHLVGSATSDFLAELSELYARDCLETVADPIRYEHVIAHVSPGGVWRFPADLTERRLAASEPLDAADAVRSIASLGITAMVPQMFCVPGMTHYRALFDVLGIPYLGNPPEAMALAASKPRARAVVAAAGVAVPEGQLAEPGDRPSVAPPVVVKPAGADNSLGVTLVRSQREMDAALDAAFAHDRTALVERYVELGREVRCGVIERHGRLEVLPLEEYAVDSERKPIRDAADKVRSDTRGAPELVAKDAEHAWIVDAADPVNDAVGRAARACHRALGCRHYGLFDFRVDPDGTPWFLEASLYCSFAEQSVLCAMARADGTSPAELFAATLDTALDRTEAAR